MMTFKDYGKRVGITYEAVRQLTVTHAAELEGHIHKQGRARMLDDDAVKILDAARGGSPLVIVQAARDEELDQLRNENKALLLQVAALQGELLKEREKVVALQSAELQRLEAQKKGFWARLFGSAD